MARAHTRRQQGNGNAGAAARLRNAVEAHRRGDLAAAEAGYREVLTAQPDEPDALNLLGVALHQRGLHHDAAALIRRAIASAPRRAAYHLHLAQVCLATGEAESGLEAVDRAATLEPGRAGLQALRGDLFRAAGKPAQAAEAYRQALAREPADAALHTLLGEALEDTGDRTAALSAYDAALAVDPVHRPAHRNALRASAADGDLLAMLERGSRALEVLGADAEAATAHAEACAALGRPADGLSTLTALPEAVRTTTRIMELEVRLLEAADRPDAAAETCRHAADAVSGARRARWLMLAGSVHERAGSATAAEAAYRAAVAADPAEPRARSALIEAGAATDEDIEAAHTLRTSPETPPHGVAALGFALAGQVEATGRFDEAFALYAEANQLVASERRFDPEAMDAHAARVITASAEQIGQWPGIEAPDGPIFIVGMPRSGSTLLERMLGAHPCVAAGGERDDLRWLGGRVASLATDGTGFPEGVAALDTQAVKALRREYAARTDHLLADGARFTDKLPANFLRLGLIRRLLPGARIVHLRRDARDTCVSCFTTHFERGQSFTYSLDWLARFHHTYAVVMEHWQRILGDALLEVDYESLVSAPEATLQRVLHHCGLPWDPACLAFQAGHGSVATASRWQVRRPLHEKSIGRWRRFRAHLGPIATLEGAHGPGGPG